MRRLRPSPEGSDEDRLSLSVVDGKQSDVVLRRRVVRVVMVEVCHEGGRSR